MFVPGLSLLAGKGWTQVQGGVWKLSTPLWVL